MRAMLEFFMVVTVGVVLGLATSALLITPFALVDRIGCDNLRGLGQTTEYRIIGGCFIKTEDGFVTQRKWEGNMQKLEVK